MDSQEFKSRIFSKRPRYANIYKDLIASLANKGNKKTEYIQFGPIYQLYIYAFYIGIHRNERVSLPSRESTTDFLEFGKWKPESLIHFILMSMFSRIKDFNISAWDELEDMDESQIDLSVRSLITAIEEYANAGLSYLQGLFEEDRNRFNETYIFADILKELVEEKEKIIESDKDPEQIEIDKLKTLINKGESPKVEFKSTLSYCLREKSSQKYIEHEVMKTIAAFLNSSGGNLLIGVEDNKNILGLVNDFSLSKKNKDKIDLFQIRLDNLIENYLGNHIHDLLEIDFPQIDDLTICRIEVKAASSEKMLTNKSKNNVEEFYIRRSSSTIKLEPSEMLKYLKEHWS